MFLDANVLFSAAYREGSGLLRLWELDDVELVTSTYALEEVDRNLSGMEREKRLAKLTKTLRVVAAASPSAGASRLPRGVTLPDDDLPILLSAIEARATHLLTGDRRDFGALFGKSVAGVVILPPGDYLRARRRR